MDRYSEENAGYVNEDMLNTIKIAGDMLNATINSVSAMVNKLINDRGKTGEALIESLHSIISATICVVIETGTNLEDGVMALSIGVLKNFKSTGQGTLSSISAFSAAVIKSAADTEADVAVVARGLVSGVIFSAKEHSDGAKLARSRGAVDYIAKPFDADDMTSVIGKYCPVS